MVMVYHQTIIQGSSYLDRTLVRVAHFGWCGVDLFFVLSGFLITGILFDSKGSHHYFRNFYARRALRIFPLYYAVVFFCLVALPRLPHPKAAAFGRISGDEIWYWTYLSNYSIAARDAFRHGILDVSWSLAIEEQFYLVWPGIVMALSRVALMRTCLAVVVAAAVLRTTLLQVGVGPIPVYVLTLTRMDALAAGAFLALAMRESTSAERVKRLAGPIALVAGAATLLMWGYGTNYLWSGTVTQTGGYTLLAIGFSALLAKAVTAPGSSLLPRLLSTQFLRLLGKYSYAMYLFHLPLRALVRDTLYKDPTLATPFGAASIRQVTFYFVSTALTLAAAALSWRLFEEPILRLKRFFPRREKRLARVVAQQ